MRDLGRNRIVAHDASEDVQAGGDADVVEQPRELGGVRVVHARVLRDGAGGRSDHRAVTLELAHRLFEARNAEDAAVQRDLEDEAPEAPRAEAHRGIAQRLRWIASRHVDAARAPEHVRRQHRIALEHGENGLRRGVGAARERVHLQRDGRKHRWPVAGRRDLRAQPREELLDVPAAHSLRGGRRRGGRAGTSSCECHRCVDRPIRARS